MSVNYSLALLLERRSLAERLEQFEPYITVDPSLLERKPDPLGYYSAGSLAQDKSAFVRRVPKLLRRVNEPEPKDDILADDSAKLFLRNESSSILLLWTTNWMQQIFKLTMRPPYMLVGLDYSMRVSAILCI